MKLRLTAIVEFEVHPDDYPPDSRTPDAMLQMELAVADDLGYGEYLETQVQENEFTVFTLEKVE